MHSIFAAWLIVLLSLTNLSAAARPSFLIQAGTPIPFDEYWELVRSTRRAITWMEAQPEAAVRAQLEGLASQWERVTAVELSDETVMQVDSAYLTAELRRVPPEVERLAKLLEALLYAHEQYPQKVFTLQDIEPLKTILARPEFQWQ